MSEDFEACLQNMNRDQLILLWSNLKQESSTIANREKLVRSKLIESCFNQSQQEGTEHLELGNGWKLTCRKSQTYKVDANEEQIRKWQSTANYFADLFSFEPKMSVSKFKELMKLEQSSTDQPNYGEVLKMLREVESMIVVKPGSPQLELQQPKE